jgi:hypothetical protein
MGKGVRKELPVDQLLITAYGNKTPQQIAEETGMTPMEVAKRTAEILGERDYLGEDAKVQVVISRLDAISAEIERRMPSFSDRNIAAAANASAGALGRVLAELRKLREESRVDLDALSNKYAQTMVAIVEASFNRLLGALQERYPDADPLDLQAEFQGHILEISKEYDN